MVLCQTRPKLCFLAIPRQLSLFNNQLKKDTIIYLPRSDVFHERRTESFQQAEKPSCSERRHKASAYRRGGEFDDKSQGIIRAGARTRTYRGGATTSRATAGKEAHKRAHIVSTWRGASTTRVKTRRRAGARARAIEAEQRPAPRLERRHMSDRASERVSMWRGRRQESRKMSDDASKSARLSRRSDDQRHGQRGGT